jgi:hypothetical protein
VHRADPHSIRIARSERCGGDGVLGKFSRPDPRTLDPHLLAGCLTGPRPRTGSGLSRSDARRLTVPLLPISEQRTLGQAFARLTAFDDAVRRLADLGAEYVVAATAELTAGRAAGGDEA